MRSHKHRTDSDYSVVHKPHGSNKDVHVSFENESRATHKDHLDHRKSSLQHQLSHVNERDEGSDDEVPSHRDTFGHRESREEKHRKSQQSRKLSCVDIRTISRKTAQDLDSDDEYIQTDREPLK
jgi:hypothetical protein